MPPPERVFALLRQASGMKFQRPHFANIDLSMPQIALMRWVGRYPGSHLGEIAEGLELTAPTVSVGVRRLVEKGWLECRPDMRDKRAICVYLSKKGERLRKKVGEMQQAEVNRLLGRLSLEEQNQLVGLLEKMLSRGSLGEHPAAEIRNEMEKEAIDE